MYYIKVRGTQCGITVHYTCIRVAKVMRGRGGRGLGDSRRSGLCASKVTYCLILESRRFAPSLTANGLLFQVSANCNRHPAYSPHVSFLLTCL